MPERRDRKSGGVGECGEALARQRNMAPVGIDPDEIDYYSEVIQF
jgi:hypothetical protein